MVSTKDVKVGKSYKYKGIWVTIIRKLLGEKIKVEYDNVKYEKRKPTKYLTHTGDVVTNRELER